MDPQDGSEDQCWGACDDFWLGGVARYDPKILISSDTGGFRTRDSRTGGSDTRGLLDSKQDTGGLKA